MSQEYEDQMRAQQQERARQAHQQDLEQEAGRLQGFKAYVHARLDQDGVPTNPDGPHSKEGCRVGDRLDWLLKSRADLLAALKTLLADMEYEYRDRNGDADHDGMDAARAAIALAKAK